MQNEKFKMQIKERDNILFVLKFCILQFALFILH